jgi:hypothetical protein
MDLEFGTWVHIRRTALGLSQARLAAIADVHQPTIAAIEKGHRSATEPVRRKLTAALQARPGDLLASLRDEVVALVERHGARNPRVFGSIARGADTVWSDVDLLVTFPDTAARLAYFDLVQDLEELLTVEVDVVDDASTGRAAEQARREALAL